MEEIIWGRVDLMQVANCVCWDVHVFRVCLRVPASAIRVAPSGYHKKLTYMSHFPFFKFHISNL